MDLHISMEHTVMLLQAMETRCTVGTRHQAEILRVGTGIVAMKGMQGRGSECLRSTKR